MSASSILTDVIETLVDRVVKQAEQIAQCREEINSLSETSYADKARDLDRQLTDLAMQYADLHTRFEALEAENAALNVKMGHGVAP